MAAVMRLTIRVRSKGRLFIDDMLLTFACLTLILASVILQIELGTIYIAEELTALYKSGRELPKDLDIPPVIARYHVAQDVHGTMCWLTVFSVKFSFLFFFRQLVNKIPNLEYYWKWVLGLNCVACLYCLLYVVAECQYQSFAAFVSIPIIILWKVRMQFSQKIGIGAFLCLSICMITLAAIRLSKIHIGGTTVGSWQYFWLELEASAAVCTVSLTAFRSFFVDHGEVDSKGGRRWYSSAIARNLERRKLKARLQEREAPPNVSIASLSDMQFYLGKNSLRPQRPHESAYGQLKAGRNSDDFFRHQSRSEEGGAQIYYHEFQSQSAN
ncbi:hypothetical protein ACLMJK_001643 [Lecanora helva]